MQIKKLLKMVIFLILLIFLTSCQTRPIIIYPEIGIKPIVPEPDWIAFRMLYIDNDFAILSLGEESVIIPAIMAEAITTNLINRIAYTGLLQNDIDYYVTTIKLMGEDES